MCFTSFRIKAQELAKKYYHFTNQAELAIIDSAYSKALSNYESAFAVANKGFAKDYYNASICALYVKDKSKTKEYINVLLKKGIDTSYISQQDVFLKFCQSKMWKKIKANYQRPIKDSVYIHTLDSLAKVDQLFRVSWNYNEIYGDTVRKIDSVNAHYLIKLINKKGFPTSEKVGIDRPHTLYPSRDFSLIAIHSIQLGYLEILPILKEAYENLDFHIYAYVGLEDMSEISTDYGSEVLIKHSRGEKWRMRILPEEELRRRNENRAKIGMETWEEYSRKVIFSLKKQPFAFAYFNSKSILLGLPQKLIEKDFKNSVEIDID